MCRECHVYCINKAIYAQSLIRCPLIKCWEGALYHHDRWCLITPYHTYGFCNKGDGVSLPLTLLISGSTNSREDMGGSRDILLKNELLNHTICNGLGKTIWRNCKCSLVILNKYICCWQLQLTNSSFLIDLALDWRANFLIIEVIFPSICPNIDLCLHP